MAWNTRYVVVDKVAAVLKEYGRCTRQQIENVLKIRRSSIQHALTSMGKNTRYRKRSIHVCDWDMYGPDGLGKRFPRPVYALGDLPNKRKPRSQTVAERTAVNMATRRARRARVNSVFALGAKVAAEMKGSSRV